MKCSFQKQTFRHTHRLYLIQLWGNSLVTGDRKKTGIILEKDILEKLELTQNTILCTHD